MSEALFESILPTEKLAEEAKEVKKSEKKKPETVSIEKEILEEKISQVRLILKQANNKIESLQENIRQMERRIEILDKTNSTKDFGDFVMEFNEKIHFIEEAKKEIFLQSSKVQNKYFEISGELENFQDVLSKLKRFDRVFVLADRLENFEADNKILREMTEEIRSSILENKFYSLIAILQQIKKKEVLIAVLDEIDRTIEEMKSKNLWRIDKVALAEDFLNGENVKALKSVTYNIKRLV